MRFAVLASPESWYLKDLARAAAGRHDLLPVTFGDLSSTLSLTGAAIASGPTPLDSVDAVIVRTMPPGSLEQVVFRMDALARLEAAGVVVLNPST